MDKNIIKKGVESAQKELQEKEIEKIKFIVKSYLEKINEKTKERALIDEEIKGLKKDLDDLKSGRLDKIEERQALDPGAKKRAIVIVHKNTEHYYPAKPWYSEYRVEYVPGTVTRCTDPGVLPFWSCTTGSDITLPSTTSCSGNSSMAYINVNSSLGPPLAAPMANVLNAVGTVFQNFVGGTYKLDNGDIINL